MSQHIALFHFDVSGLDVRGEVLGTAYFIEGDGKGLLLAIPAENGEFGVVGTHLWEDGLVHPHRWDPDGRVLLAVVKIIQVAVVVESTASADEDTEAGRNDGDRALADGLATAVAVVEDFVLWLRAEAGQFWLGPSHKTVVLDRFDLIDVERGGVVRNVSIPQRLTIVTGDPDAAATRAQIDAAIQHVASQDEVPVADTLLADARAAIRLPSVSVEWRKDPRDLARAVLLAAIASEVKIKTTLDQKSPVDRRGLVKIITSNPRDVTVAVAQLVHKTMEAAVGKSLQKDDKEPFAAVEKLFSVRTIWSIEQSSPQPKRRQRPYRRRCACLRG